MISIANLKRKRQPTRRPILDGLRAATSALVLLSVAACSTVGDSTGTEAGRLAAGNDRPGPSATQVAGCNAKAYLKAAAGDRRLVSTVLADTGKELLKCDSLQAGTVSDWQSERGFFFRAITQPAP